MKFPQFGSLFSEYVLCDLVQAPVWAVCLVILLQKGDFREALVVSILIGGSIALTVVDWLLERRKILCQDENGISLTVRDKTQWAFRWDEIEKLTYGSRYRHKSVRFVPRQPPVCKPGSEPQYEFHLSKPAREALARYCPLPIQKK